MRPWSPPYLVQELGWQLSSAVLLPAKSLRSSFVVFRRFQII